MKLALDATVAQGYTSASQWARRVTEAWASSELFCVACPSPKLKAHVANTKVEDYHCPRCSRRVQLKAKSGRIGRVVANSGYATKVAAIRKNKAPDYAFLGYDRDRLQVRDLFVVPGHFLTESVISARKPLAETARRAGWIGSNIHLDRIADSGKVWLVQDSVQRPKATVRQEFDRLAFVRALPAEGRGWLNDVLQCVEELAPRRGTEFSLKEVYGFEQRLAARHPANHNVQPKIRQQLQLLRKRGLVKFEGSGRYTRL